MAPSVPDIPGVPKAPVDMREPVRVIGHTLTGILVVLSVVVTVFAPDKQSDFTRWVQSGTYAVTATVALGTEFIRSIVFSPDSAAKLIAKARAMFARELEELAAAQTPKRRVRDNPQA